MAEHSTYRVHCVCGAPIITTTTDGKCSACGRGYKLEWQADAPKEPPVKTITEVYGE